MQDLSAYRNRHADLRLMIEDLQALLTPEMLRVRPNAKTAYQLLCDLGLKVKEHLSEEDRGVYPSLLIHDDPKIKALAWGFINGEKPLRKTFDDYHKKWLKNCDFNFTEDFMRETHDVFHMIADRMARDDQVLFPNLLEIGLFHEVRV